MATLVYTYTLRINSGVKLLGSTHRNLRYIIQMRIFLELRKVVIAYLINKRE